MYEGVFINNTISYADIIGEGFSVGGIAGQANGEIINSEAHGTVKGIINVGGLIGINENIVKSSFATGKVVGEKEVGGLIGYNYNSKLKGNYSTGNVIGDINVGGLVGVNHGGIIRESFAKGNVDGDSGTGGLIGGLNEPENSIVSYSYYDKESTGQSDNEGKGIPKTTNEMLQQSTFEPEWDFDNIWQIDEGSSYPYFQWQNNNIPVP